MEKFDTTPPPPPPRGGTSIYVHIRFVPFLRPPFSALNFCSNLQSISFSQITEKSAPEHHNFSVFAAPETIISKPSRSVAAHGCLITAASPNAFPNTKRSASAPGFFLYSRPECSQTRPTTYKSAPACPKITNFTL